MIRYAIIVSIFVSSNLDAQQKTSNQLLLLAQQKIKVLDWSAAKDYLNRCLIADPALVEAYMLRAEVNEKLSKPTEALTDHSIAIALDPASPDPYLKRGVLAFQLGRYDLARTDFRKLLSLNGTETNTVYFRQSNNENVDKIFTLQGSITDMIYNYLGLIETHSGDFNNALLYFDSAIRINPNSPDYYAHRGLTFIKQGEDGKAVPEFEKSLIIDPNHSVAKSNLATLKRKEGKFEEAEKYLKEAKGEAPTSPSHYSNLGLLKLEMGQYHEAILNFDSALALDQNYGEILINRGLAKEKINDWNGAKRDFDKAIKIDEEWPKAWFTEGNYFMKQKQWNEALENYSVAIAFDENYSLAYYNRAIVHYQLKQFNKACSDLEKAEEKGMAVENKMKGKFCKE